MKKIIFKIYTKKGVNTHEERTKLNILFVSLAEYAGNNITMETTTTTNDRKPSGRPEGQSH